MEERRKNQNIALDLNNSIWVSASAGSGKTTILVKRLLKLLVSDVEIDKIICITYTRTAANEMKSRIYSELSNWVVLDEESLYIRLKELFGQEEIQKSLLQKARVLFAKVIDRIDDLKIFTIHSFCQQILKKFPIEAGLSPNFEIVEEVGSNALIDEAIDKFLKNIEIDFLDKVKSVIVDEKQFYHLIKEMIEKRTDLSYIRNFDFDYKTEIYKIFNLNYSDNKEDCIIEFIDNIPFDSLLDIINEISSKLTEEQKNKISYINDFENLSFKEQINNIENYLRVFLTANFEPESEKYARGLLNKIKKLNPEYFEILDFERTRCYEFWQKYNNINIAELSINSIEIGLKIIDIYQKLKEEKHLLDYNDLIINTYRLLANTEYSAWISYKLDNGIDYILLDEAQDTSKMQWLLVQTITDEFFAGETERNRNIFIVGDEKQSIFKFQGANIEMFNERYQFYKDVIGYSRKKFCKVDLNYSYRSLSNILKFVDSVFENNEEKISKLSDKIHHSCVRINENDNGYVEVWPLSSAEKKEENNTEWVLDFSQEIESKNKEKLANQIATKIKYFIQNKKVITVRGKQRNVKYSDIMILFKKRDDIFMSYLIRNLNKNNIPNSGYDKLHLLDEIIIKDFLCLLNFIVFPEDDLNLANIIKSPFIGLNEDDLLNLCVYKNNNNVSLYESIKENNKNVALFLEDIVEKSKILSLYDLCVYILDNFNNKEKIINRFSESIIDVINQFLFLVKNYEDKNNSSLISFIQSLKQEDIETKKDLDYSTNQVKLMTVHASKGLQSPIVFLISNKFKINYDDSLIWNEDLFESKLPIYNRNWKTKILEEQGTIIKDKLYAEYLRLLYVALTRSENELYICGWLDQNEKADKDKDENKVKEKPYTSWYDLSNIAIQKLGIKKQYYFDNEKYYYSFGEEQQYKFIEEIDKSIDNQKQSLLINIKKFEEVDLSSKIINPSQFYKHSDRDNNLTNLNTAIIKGNAVHKLLEVLPTAKIEERNEIADIYLNNSFYTLTKEERIEIKNKVIDILNKYSEYFGGMSKSEVPIIGEIDGQIISGQIDRLIIKNDEIVIIDYKNTMRNYKSSEVLPKEFIKQLELYKNLVSKIYENKHIKCYILLTSYLRMIEVEC